MSSTFKDRMIEFIDHISEQRKIAGLKSMGQTKFENYVGLPNATIAKIGEGVSTVTLAKIKDKFPELNTDWLLTGKGSMLLDGKQPSGKEIARSELVKIADKLFNLDEIEERLSKVEARLGLLFPDDVTPSDDKKEKEPS